VKRGKVPDWLKLGLTQQRLRELLHYDPETGVFTSRVFRSRCPVGKEVGSTRLDGYCELTIDRQRYLAHRLAWLYVYGYLPGYIDHIDCNPSNNRISNLREVTRTQNQRNMSIGTSNTSGAKGVAWDKSRNKWIVNIRYDGRSKHIGRFDNFDDAVNAVRRARDELHGEFANHG